MQLHLDVHSELCPVRVGDKFRIVLADTLNEDGSAVTSLLPKVIGCCTSKYLDIYHYRTLINCFLDKSLLNLDRLLFGY